MSSDASSHAPSPARALADNLRSSAAAAGEDSPYNDREGLPVRDDVAAAIMFAELLDQTRALGRQLAKDSASDAEFESSLLRKLNELSQDIGAEKDKEAYELKRAVGVMLALKDFEEKYNSSAMNLMSELARNFVDLQSQLAAAVSRVTVHVPAALSALAGNVTNHRVTWAADAIRRAQVQAGITPLERRSDVAPKRGRPPKPKLPDPSAPPALPIAGDASGSAKRCAVGDEADALDGSDGAQVARDLTEDLAGNAADEGSEEEA